MRVMLLRVGLLAVIAAAVLVAVAAMTRFYPVSGRLAGAGAGPFLVEVVEPAWRVPVTGWTDPAGRFRLFAVRDGTAHVLRIERAVCGPVIVSGVRFVRGREAVLEVPPC